MVMVNKNYARIFKILLMFVVLKLLFLLLLYFRSFDATVRSIRQRAVQFDELLIDRRNEPSWEERVAAIKREMPSFPLDGLERLTSQQRSLKCAPAVNIWDIEFHNDYWQVLREKKLNYYIFGAYYDNRETVPEAPVIRLLTMVNANGDKDGPYSPLFCQIWVKNREEPLIEPVFDRKVIWFWGGSAPNYFPTLLTCAMPNGTMKHVVPEMVSLVSDRCARATNLLSVIYNPPKPPVFNNATTGAAKPRFAVCVKTLDFPYVDMSWRLIEWLEVMRMLGAEKITLYNGQIHANMTRVLEHYMKESPGFVELRGLSMGRGEPYAHPHLGHYHMMADGFNRILNEMIPINDCFYRNMYNFEYIGVFDTDEVIMPLGNMTNWVQLVEKARIVRDYLNYTSEDCTDWVDFCFRNAYFPRYPERPKYYRNLPSYFYMLQHVERVQEHCDRYSATKCLHNTKYAVGLHNHFTLHYTDRACCGAKSVPIEFAQLQHYREPDNKTRLIDPIVDDSIWRFQPQLQERVTQKYYQLGLLPSEQQAADARDLQRRQDEEQLKSAAAALHHT